MFLIYITAIVFVYDYYAGAETLMSRHFNGPQNLNSFYMDSSSRSYNPGNNNGGNNNNGGGNGGGNGSGKNGEKSSLSWCKYLG